MMEVSDQIELKFYGVDFPVVNFLSEKSFRKSDKREIKLSVHPKVFYPKDKPKSFKIIQEITILSEGFFNLSIVAVGSFEVKSKDNLVQFRSFVNVNAPAIMFPYIRSFISTLTINLGNVTGPIVIPTQFFKGDIEEVNSIEDKIKS